MWNRAANFKHIWVACKQKDNLWVKWIHHIYLKDEDIWEHNAPIHSSWYWRKLMSIRDEYREHKSKLNDQYSIAAGYRLLQGNLEKVHWDNVVWGRFNIPKCSFVYWRVMLNRLKTKDRIKAYGNIPNSDCLLCEEVEESAIHLFF